MRKLYLAVDPGVNGAAAVVDSDCGLVALRDLPVIRDGKLAWIDSEFGSWLREISTTEPSTLLARAYVERVTAQSGFGTANAFRFGLVLGSILAQLQARFVPVELVAASKWKTALGLGSEKRAALDKARLLFPAADLDLAKHHNRAEALLIAHYGLRSPTK